MAKRKKKEPTIAERWKELDNRQKEVRELWQQSRTIEREVKEGRRQLACESLGVMPGETILMVSGLRHNETDHPCLVVGIAYQEWRLELVNNEKVSGAAPVVRRRNKNGSWSTGRIELRAREGHSWRHPEKGELDSYVQQSSGG